MKKLLALCLMAVLILSCLTACDLFKKDNGVTYKEYENCAIFTFDDFPIREIASFELARTGLGEGAIYYQVNLEEGALSINYKDTGLIHQEQPLGEFTADDEMPVNGSSGYVEGDKITITFESDSSVSGEIIIAFTEDALKGVCGDLQLHEHMGEWRTSETSHYYQYACGCSSVDIAELHSDNDENYVCDVCEYQMPKPASQGLEFVKSNDGTKYAVKSIGTCTDKDIVIPNTFEDLPVVGILPEAFFENTTITSVVIPDNVSIIYESAFMECTALETVKFGDGLKGIWECAFGSCVNLKEITLPDGLEYIYTHAFDGCASLEEIVIPDSVTRIEPWAFANCTSLQSISFSDNITVIAESMCYGCISLMLIDFGDGVTHVQPDAFYGCISLERLYIPKNIIALTRAFTYCGALNYVEFEIKSGWKWSSKHGGFNSKDVTNPQTNAYNMKGVWSGSSWQRENYS